MTGFMVEGKTHNPGTKRLDLNKYFMQAVDRAYFRAFPGNIRGQSTSNTYDSNHLTRKEFLLLKILKSLMLNFQAPFRPYTRKIILHTDFYSKTKLKKVQYH